LKWIGVFKWLGKILIPFQIKILQFFIYTHNSDILNHILYLNI
jgi:hypothetical protein